MKKLMAAIGAVAVVGMASAGPAYAVDLGVLTPVDVCNDLGLAGLMLSSHSNCLTISGEAEYSFSWGDYDDDRRVVDDLSYSGRYDVMMGDGALDWESSATVSLTFTGTAPSDFGPVRGVIIIEGESETVIEDLVLDDEADELGLDKAYISIGDTTVLSVGLKSTAAKTGADTAFTYQEMFNEDKASGVGYNSDATDTDIDTGGHVIQLVHDIDDGWTVTAALEDLDDLGTFIGVLEYSGDAIDAHVTFLADEVLTGQVRDWAVHLAATLSLDNYRIRGAAAFNNDGWWNLLGTAEAEFDIFTLAVAGEATSEREYGLAASGAAAVSDAVTINLGSRAFVEADSDLTVDTILEVEFEASETITLIAGGGYVYESDDPVGVTYGGLALEWNPDGDFEAELSGQINSRPGDDLGYEFNITATKALD